MTVDERLARLETLYADIRDDVSRIVTALEGPPRRDSIRGRLHTLENSEVAAKAAQAALETVRELRDRRLSRGQLILAMLGGSILALCGVITTILVILQYAHHP